MNIAEYHKMHALEKHYWWFQGRHEVILTLLHEALRTQQTSQRPIRFLDIGCGTGLLLEDLQQLGSAVGLDFSPVALEYCRGRHLTDLGRADVRNLPVRDNSVDVITALDLIEHIQDDQGLMHEIYRVLRPGGIAIMSVPAHKCLWSSHDRALHHFRRYEKGEFLQLVTSVGLQPHKYTYGMALIYLPAFAFRSLKRLLARTPSPAHPDRTDEFPLPGLVNSTLRALLHLEAQWLRRRNLPFGLSLMCIAAKPTPA